MEKFIHLLDGRLVFGTWYRADNPMFKVKYINDRENMLGWGIYVILFKRYFGMDWQ